MEWPQTAGLLCKVGQFSETGLQDNREQRGAPLHSTGAAHGPQCGVTGTQSTWVHSKSCYKPQEQSTETAQTKSNSLTLQLTNQGPHKENQLLKTLGPLLSTPTHTFMPPEWLSPTPTCAGASPRQAAVMPPALQQMPATCSQQDQEPRHSWFNTLQLIRSLPTLTQVIQLGWGARIEGEKGPQILARVS